MRADERPDPTDTQGDDAEKVEQLEDLEAGEDDASAVKGGGPKEQQSMPGGDPTD